jgi:hypothetical protein
MCIVDLQDGWRFGAAFLYKGEIHFAMLTHPEDQPFFSELGMVKLRVNGLLILKETIAGGLWQHVPQYHADCLDGWFPN